MTMTGRPFRSGALALGAGAVAAALIALGGSLLPGAADAAGEPPVNPVTLKPVSAFAGIADREARSAALFEEAGKVVMSPRCMNCHPAGDRPTQTDRMKPHQPLVVRGEGGMGPVGGLACNTCHQTKNYDAAGVPGHPEWHLAPIEMAWQGKSLGQICVQIKDKDRNGGRDLDAIVKHMAEDSLVAWGWSPGAGRTPAPGTQKEFGDLIKAWADAGAVCPKG